MRNPSLQPPGTMMGFAELVIGPAIRTGPVRLNPSYTTSTEALRAVNI